jgi:hypothetical protein
MLYCKFYHMLYASETPAAAPIYGFRCVEHALSPAEAVAWAAVLTPYLGPPRARVLRAYAGAGELLAAVLRLIPENDQG